MAFASFETLGLQAISVLLALPLATLTDGMARFLFGSLVCATAIISTAVVTTLPWEVEWQGVAVGAVLFLISGLTSAAVQYIYRLIGWSIATVVGGAAIAAFVSVLVPARISSKAALPNSTVHADNITLSLAGPVMAYPASERDAALRFPVRVDGVPPEFVVRGYTAQRWRWPKGPEIQRGGGWGDSNMDANWIALRIKSPWRDPERLKILSDLRVRQNAVRAQRGLAPIVYSPELDPNTKELYVSVPRELVTRVRRDPPAYVLSAHLNLNRPSVIGERPAVQGETISAGSEAARISQSIIEEHGNAGRQTHRLNLRISERAPALLRSSSELVGIGPILLSPWFDRAYFLVNRKSGTAASEGSYREPISKPMRIATVGITRRYLTYSVPGKYNVAYDRWTEEENWLEGATLAELKLITVGTFTKEVRIPRFEISSGNATGGAP